MKRIQSLFLLTLLTMMSVNSAAQTKVDFPKGVNLIKMTDAGVAIVGTDDALYGIDKNGKELWKNEKLRKVEANRVEILSGSELIFVSDKGLMARNRVLNVLDGTEYANPGKGSANIFAARVIHGANQLWVHNSGFKGVDVNVWDIETNTLLYNFKPGPYPVAMDESAAMTNTFAGAQPVTYTGKNTAIIHLGLAQLGEFDLNTGKAIWAFNWKPYKVKLAHDGKGHHPSKPSRGFAVMKLDEVNDVLYFPFSERLIAVDAKTGAPKWGPKDGKTGQVRDMYITDEGVLILTLKGLNLINKSTGEPIWDKPIKLKGASESLLIKDGDTFYAVSKRSVIEVDVQNRTTKALAEKIKFQGGESFTSLESFEDVLVLSSSHNAIGINKKDGGIAHSTYYKEPGMGIVEIAQNMALAGVAMAATMNSQRINSQNSSGGSYTYHQYTPRMMASRESGQAASGNIKYMSTKFKGDDASGFGVARVDIKTGETSDKIVIGSREPIYAVDEVGKLIYYKSGKNSIEIKSIN